MLRFLISAKCSYYWSTRIHVNLFYIIPIYPHSSSVSNQDSMERLMTQMKDIMKEQQEQQRAIITAALSSRSIQNENMNKPRDEDSYISGALPNERELRARIIQEEKTRIQEEFKKKSSELAAREETLLLDQRDFKNLQKVKEDKERAKVYLSSIDSLAMLKPHDERGIISLREKSRAVSVMTIKSQIRIGKTDTCSSHHYHYHYHYHFHRETERLTARFSTADFIQLFLYGNVSVSSDAYLTLIIHI